MITQSWTAPEDHAKLPQAPACGPPIIKECQRHLYNYFQVSTPIAKAIWGKKGQAQGKDCSRTQNNGGSKHRNIKKPTLNRAPVAEADVLACDVSITKAVHGDGTTG